MLREKFGEDQFVLLLGALHIEMAAWKTLGDWLAGSGWTDALEHAGAASSGAADSFLKACHVKQTRYPANRNLHSVNMSSSFVDTTVFRTSLFVSWSRYVMWSTFCRQS